VLKSSFALFFVIIMFFHKNVFDISEITLIASFFITKRSIEDTKKLVVQEKHFN